MYFVHKPSLAALRYAPYEKVLSKVTPAQGFKSSFNLHLNTVGWEIILELAFSLRLSVTPGSLKVSVSVLMPTVVTFS